MDFCQPLLCFQFLLSSLLLSVALEHRLGRQASKGLQSSKVEAGLSHTVTSQKDHRFSQSSAPQACAPMLESLKSLQRFSIRALVGGKIQSTWQSHFVACQGDFD